MATKLIDAPEVQLKVARRYTAETSLDEAIVKFGDDPSPLLVVRGQPDSTEIIGILAPFDLV